MCTYIHAALKHEISIHKILQIPMINKRLTSSNNPDKKQQVENKGKSPISRKQILHTYIRYGVLPLSGKVGSFTPSHVIQSDTVYILVYIVLYYK